MKRQAFRTNLKTETLKQLKIIAALESKAINEMLEKIILEKYLTKNEEIERIVK